MKIKLHEKAEKDLKEALDYYFEIDAKLEKKFISYLEQTFNKVLKFPNLYQYETKTAQKVLIDKFPYIVIYEQFEDIIMVLAIFHTSRNPINLEDRT